VISAIPTYKGGVASGDTIDPDYSPEVATIRGAAWLSRTCRTSPFRHLDVSSSLLSPEVTQGSRKVAKTCRSSCGKPVWILPGEGDSWERWEKAQAGICACAVDWSLK
jgi:hypothetical protein